MNPPKWPEVKAEAEKRIFIALEVLARHDTGHDEAMYQRGLIAAYRSVLAMGQRQPATEIASPDYG